MNGMKMGANRSIGIPWCLNCVGYHPDELPTKHDLAMRLINPQKTLMSQATTFKNKSHVYRNRACAFCGRVYNPEGTWFDTDKDWDRTARLVNAELSAAGIIGVDESKTKLIVAECRRAVGQLMKSIPQFQAIVRSGKRIHPDDLHLFETLTFSGRLALIITGAQEGRNLRLAGHNTGKIQ